MRIVVKGEEHNLRWHLSSLLDSRTFFKAVEGDSRVVYCWAGPHTSFFCAIRVLRHYFLLLFLLSKISASLISFACTLVVGIPVCTYLGKGHGTEWISSHPHFLAERSASKQYQSPWIFARESHDGFLLPMKLIACL